MAATSRWSGLGGEGLDLGAHDGAGADGPGNGGEAFGEVAAGPEGEVHGGDGQVHVLAADTLAEAFEGFLHGASELDFVESGVHFRAEGIGGLAGGEGPGLQEGHAGAHAVGEEIEGRGNLLFAQLERLAACEA